MSFPFFKNIIIGIIFLILFYILFRLIQKRTVILRNLNYEGFSCIAEITNKDVKRTLDANQIEELTESLSSKDYYLSNKSLKLTDFFIKGSYNSAYNGKEMSKDMLLYVLHRGYRFLDFEVYYHALSGDSANGIKRAVVSVDDGYSNATTNISLLDVLDTINMNAFSNVPNKNDPIFIQIRPIYNLPKPEDSPDDKSKKIGENTQLNTLIETALNVFTSYKYSGSVTGQTPIKKLFQKVVIIMDDSNNPNVGSKTQKLISMINMNSVNIIKCNADDSACSNATNPNAIVEALPIDTNSQMSGQNPQILTLLANSQKCNVAPVMAWMPSYLAGIASAGLSTLGDYETLFLRTGGSAFVLFNEAKSYATANNPAKLNSSILNFD